jgi:hypothetical protein
MLQSSSHSYATGHPREPMTSKPSLVSTAPSSHAESNASIVTAELKGVAIGQDHHVNPSLGGSLCVQQQESTTEAKNASWESGFTKQPSLSVPRPASSVPQPLVGTVSQQHDTPALLTRLYAMVSAFIKDQVIIDPNQGLGLPLPHMPQHTRRGVEPDFNQSPADNQAFLLGQTRGLTRFKSRQTRGLTRSNPRSYSIKPEVLLGPRVALRPRGLTRSTCEDMISDCRNKSLPKHTRAKHRLSLMGWNDGQQLLV